MIGYSASILEIFHLLNFLLLIATLLILIISKINVHTGGDPLPWSGFAASAFPVVLIIVVIRTYMYEPFKIPSESMFPMLTTGDVVLVSKSSYSIKFPLTNINLIDHSDPQRGDVAVFKYPLNTQMYFIKRVVAVPGDTVTWNQDDMYINGQKVLRDVALASRPELPDLKGFVRYSWETIGDDRYKIRRLSRNDSTQFERTSTFVRMRTNQTLGMRGIGLDENTNYLEIKIPQGFYFVMGDNRDQSSDSREWGMVSRDNFVGKAVFNVMNIRSDVPLYKFTKKITFKNLGKME